MTTIPQNPFSDLLENTMLNFLKEKIETLMKEIKNYLSVEHPGESNSRNGFYSRNWETRHGVYGICKYQETVKATFRRSCSSRINAGKRGWKTRSFICTGVVPA